MPIFVLLAAEGAFVPVKTPAARIAMVTVKTNIFFILCAPFN